jgi:4-aminobutyrate aminotransferase-like enzyme
VERLSDPALLAHVREMGLAMKSGLERMAATSQRIRDIRGAGLMWGLDIMEPAADVISRAREAGLIVISAGEHTLRLLPPLVISREDLDRGLGILRGALMA